MLRCIEIFDRRAPLVAMRITSEIAVDLLLYNSIRIPIEINRFSREAGIITAIVRVAKWKFYE